MRPADTIKELEDLARIMINKSTTFTSDSMGSFATDWYTRKVAAIGYAIASIKIEQAIHPAASQEYKDAMRLVEGGE